MWIGLGIDLAFVNREIGWFVRREENVGYIM